MINPDNILSPADGRVLVIEETDDARIRVAVFMSVSNVHVNRMPVTGKVVSVRGRDGGYLDTRKEEAAAGNKARDMLIEFNRGEMLLRQVAGFIARQIVNRAGIGETINQGVPFGMIRFGSRVEIFFPARDAEVTVKTGQSVIAGVSVIAKYKDLISPFRG